MSYLPKPRIAILILAAVAGFYPVVTALRIGNEVHARPSANSRQSGNTASSPSSSALDFDFFKNPR